MWQQKRSLVWGKVFVLLFLAVLVMVMISGPWLVEWLVSRSSNTYVGQEPLFLITLYTGGATVGALLYCLYRLLLNLGKGQVFIKKNVRWLQYVSLCCFFGGVIGFASGFYYILWWIFGAIAIFAGLLMWVIKNILEEAIRLKEENDFTI